MNSNKIKITIIAILSIILIIGIIVIVKLKLDNKDIEESNNIQTQENTQISIDKRIMLADILKENEDEILITEDNIDMTNEIIKRANLRSGIFIEQSSRDKFLDVVNEGTQNTYTISKDGYLQKPENMVKESDVTKKINDFIDSDGTLVIYISDTYKVIMDDMQLDFMVERDAYVEKYQYNSYTDIVIVNPNRLDEESEDLTKKQIYEEVLLGL